jgi:hypothetical protein
MCNFEAFSEGRARKYYIDANGVEVICNWQLRMLG